MADAQPDDAGAPPVALCCAASDGPSIREAAEALLARGHQVELAVGVDTDPGVLPRAIATLRGRGLYVLCRSHSLDRNAVDELREVLRTHDVPFGRTLTLAVDTQRPREVEERIVSVLRRMVTGRTDGRPKAWGSNTPTHEEDPDTTIRRPGGALGGTDSSPMLVGLGTEPENADPYASTSQIEMSHRGREIVPPPYTGVERTAIKQYTGAEPAVDEPYTGADHTAVKQYTGAVPTAVEPPAGAVPTADEPYTGADHTAVGPAPRPPGATRPASDPPRLPSVAAPPASAPRFAPPVPSIAASVSRPSPGSSMGSSPAMSDALSVYTPPPVSAEESSADFDAMTTGGRMGRALGSPAGLALVIGGLVVVGLGVTLALLLGRDDPEAQTAASTASDAATKGGEAKAVDAKKTGGEKTGGEKTGGEKTGGEKADAEKADGIAPTPDDTPDASSEDVRDAQDAPSPDDEPPPEASPRPRWAAAADPGDALPSRSFAPEDDPPDVVEALRSREVRALDVLLVAPERKGTLTFDQAVTYCKELEVARLRDWRVPAIGELNAMATAKMLGKAIFWSMTPGDSFGDLRLVVGTKKGTTIVAVPKTWDGAKIVCVRPRQP